MSRKDFYKGMEAAAKPFEEKFQKQSQAFEELAQSINNKLDDFSFTNDRIIDELNAMEKKRLYDLNTLIDIANLGDDEKELLMAILYTLVDMTEYVTEYQQAFLRSVKNHLQVIGRQSSIDLSVIENIENLNDQKAILQTVMEFLFLENASHGYMDEYSDVMEYFSVNKKGIREIQDCIDKIYKATGLEGIAENYGYVPEEPVQNTNNNYLGSEKRVYSDFPNLKISEGLAVNTSETKTFENLNLLFEECITVNKGGKLVINNCTIKTKRTLDTAILSDDAEVIISGCVIDYFGLDDKQFFTAKNSKLLIQNTELVDCHRLLSHTTEDTVIEFSHCVSNNLGIQVTSDMKRNILRLTDCDFISSNDGNGEFYENRQYAFSAPNLVVRNCQFSNFQYGVLDIPSLITFFNFNPNDMDSIDLIEITDSSFINCNGAICDNGGAKEILITDSYFENCVDIFTGEGFDEKYAVKFIDCRLENCKGLLSNAVRPFYMRNTTINEGFMILQTREQVTMEHCILTNWNLEKAVPYLHHYNYSVSIPIEVGKNSLFKDCIFKNIDLEGSDWGLSNYFIGGNSNGATILADSCEFENISSYEEIFRKVEHYTLYSGTLIVRGKKKAAYTQVEIKNCTGL
ncbi:hypothetical protein [Niallia sp. MER 6]|uniref:hypothetical protein n=1 Tax=Niallia sp. MER 6 TaxID=2939567 RepID=UPI00203F2666|nr:hypothetical protein [Niallia sp. MER 6]MCM3031502.1 hypothetical protein [Niallia sp. MER 6]